MKVNIIISKLRESKATKEVAEKLDKVELGESVEYNGKVYTKASLENCEVSYSDDWQAYKFDHSEVVGSYTKVFEVSANDIETVIVNSFEGGSNYWLELDTENIDSVWQDKPSGLPYSTWATMMLLEGKTLHFVDMEDEEEKFTLNLEKLIKGFKLNAKERPFDSDLENGDATTSDCILQYGMFGEIIFG